MSKCRCGLPHHECAEAWDKQLGVVGHASDGPNRSSEYHRNLRAINLAKAEGLDPYHHQLNAQAGRQNRTKLASRVAKIP